MSRYIDADNRETTFEDYVLIPQSVWQSVLEKLDKASAKDVAPVIRAKSEIIYCGECKYMMPNGSCSVFADPSIRPSASDYCSNAERRQDVEDSKEMPSADPDMKHAKWIPVTNSRGGHKCSLCNSYAPSCKSGYELLSNYCPDCGARMDLTT